MYKIGELADISKVSKRTIDYYTRIGLLECTRSSSNYRYYDNSALENLKLIEQCQRMHMTLEEIKHRLKLKKSNSIDYHAFEKQVDHIKDEMNHLNGEIKDILQVANELNEEEKKRVLSRISPQAAALLQSLVMFSG
ncbi:MerR family transcriptional regulator [Bacillus sp. SCS-153A]|uniref:MerR family transcriptional regulator n=1 Tax=Rossellomorea sedimentorum TaxID=3115294 RepID=UPI0039063DB0